MADRLRLEREIIHFLMAQGIRIDLCRGDGYIGVQRAYVRRSAAKQQEEIGLDSTLSPVQVICITDLAEHLAAAL